MTDDAMRKAFEKWYLGEHPTNIDVKSIARTADYELMITRINWIAWQAATTVLLEKLRGEGALNAAVTNLREMDNWLTKDAEGDTIENYEAIARAVIEACILLIQGMESEQ